MTGIDTAKAAMTTRTTRKEIYHLGDVKDPGNTSSYGVKRQQTLSFILWNPLYTDWHIEDANRLPTEPCPGGHVAVVATTKISSDTAAEIQIELSIQVPMRPAQGSRPLSVSPPMTRTCEN
jgi:hypothetical protein